jgi:hypothetical protein
MALRPVSMAGCIRSGQVEGDSPFCASCRLRGAIYVYHLASFEERVGGDGRSSPSSPSNARWNGCRGAGPCQALAAERGGRNARRDKGQASPARIATADRWAAIQAHALAPRLSPSATSPIRNSIEPPFAWASGLAALLVPIPDAENPTSLSTGQSPELPGTPPSNARLPCGTGTSYVARIFR